ncbi:hypothetical protein RFI_07799 [Reticulomyxa filosa]|uniref:Uncharacterized protein n=1 Tax=Reticulomyxa filosa TaxID=46433 RepID=X6NTP8_RETFI|nr:hypothetical protein RFI_07799 [Reticulomyxa filosa]|eukprot:ETO29328.1 hypothetical protein RFI_07799 [Reticulomyxa filosa]
MKDQPFDKRNVVPLILDKYSIVPKCNIMQLLKEIDVSFENDSQQVYCYHNGYAVNGILCLANFGPCIIDKRLENGKSRKLWKCNLHISQWQKTLQANKIDWKKKKIVNDSGFGEIQVQINKRDNILLTNRQYVNIGSRPNREDSKTLKLVTRFQGVTQDGNLLNWKLLSNQTFIQPSVVGQYVPLDKMLSGALGAVS